VWVADVTASAFLEELVKRGIPYGGPIFGFVEGLLYGELQRGEYANVALRVVMHSAFAGAGLVGGTLMHTAWNIIAYRNVARIAGSFIKPMMFKHAAGRGVEARLTQDFLSFDMAPPPVAVGALPGRQVAPVFDHDGLINGLSPADAPLFENVCGERMQMAEAHEAHGLTAVIAKRTCEGGPGVYFIGGLVPEASWLLRNQESRIAFCARGCSHSLANAISRYAVKEVVPKYVRGEPTPRTVIVEREWLRAIEAPWTAAMMTAVRLAPGRSVPEYAEHLVGQKRREFLEQMCIHQECELGLRAMSKNNQKTFTTRKAFRILMYQSPASLSFTGPYIYAASETMHVFYHVFGLPVDEEAMRYARVREAVRASAARGDAGLHVWIFAAGDDNHVLGHLNGRMFDLEDDISAADASSTIYSTAVGDRFAARTGFYPDPQGTAQVELWSEEFAMAMANNLAQIEGWPTPLPALRTIHGTSLIQLVEWAGSSTLLTADSKHRGYRIRLPPGVVASGTSKTKDVQTVMCAYAFVAALAQAGAETRTAVVVHCDDRRFEVASHCDWRALGKAHWTTLEEVLERTTAAMERLNYKSKMILHEFDAPRTSMCSAYFYPAIVDGLVVKVPFIKLGRWLRRLSTLQPSVARGSVNGVVLGMLQGWLALGGWMHFVQVVVRVMMSWVPKGTQPIVLNEWRMLQEAAGEIHPVSLDVQIEHWCAIYNLTPDMYDEVLGDIRCYRPGRAIVSRVLGMMLEVEA
jgi:hypothetical protein